MAFFCRLVVALVTVARRNTSSLWQVSTLITSAPSDAKIMVAVGPATAQVKSMTRNRAGARAAPGRRAAARRWPTSRGTSLAPAEPGRERSLAVAPGRAPAPGRSGADAREAPRPGGVAVGADFGMVHRRK